MYWEPGCASQHCNHGDTIGTMVIYIHVYIHVGVLVLYGPAIVAVASVMLVWSFGMKAVPAHAHVHTLLFSSKAAHFTAPFNIKHEHFSTALSLIISCRCN